MIVKLPLNCSEIADLISGELQGSTSEKVASLNRLEFAGKGDITFYSDQQYEKFLKGSNATCVILNKNYDGNPGENQVYIRVDDPYRQFVNLLQLIAAGFQKKEGGIDPDAVVSPNAIIDPSAYIGPWCEIGDGCRVGKNTVLNSGVKLYPAVSIGENSMLHSNVVCYQDTLIGNDCIIHAGAVIGSDGFGYVEHEDGTWEKIPQLGNVIIGNNVEIGANTTIDRALVGSTILEDGVKIDNLVQIAHNVIIGENTAIASQVGIAGTCRIGKRNRLAGQSGLAGHLDTADDVILIAQSGVSKSLMKKGVYFGSPAKELKKAFRIEASLRLLPELEEEFREFKKKVSQKLGLD